MTTKTTLHSLWTKQINLPDGHRLFAASGNVYIGALPSEVAADERGIWAMADESGIYPHDTDDGVLWLDFRRPLDAGASKTEGYDGATPTIPLLDKGGHHARPSPTRSRCWHSVAGSSGTSTAWARECGGSRSNMRVHFRYHDSVDALIGTDRYRYEVHELKDIGELIKSLAPKGYDEFSFRPLGTLEPWRGVKANTPPLQPTFH